MRTRVDLSLSLLAPEPTPLQALVDRTRVLLETRPGTLPWAPRLGCDLDAISRGAATTGRMADAQVRIHDALAHGLPEGALKGVSVSLVDVQPGTTGGGIVPFAERALASSGARASLDVRVILESDEGPVTLEARLAP